MSSPPPRKRFYDTLRYVAFVEGFHGEGWSASNTGGNNVAHVGHFTICCRSSINRTYHTIMR